MPYLFQAAGPAFTDSAFVVMRACFPANCPKFISLRHLILELALYGDPESHFDVLNIACLLEAAPLIEKFDLHVSYSFKPFTCKLVQDTSGYQLTEYF